MTPPLEQACDSQRIDDYLNEQLSAPEQVEFEAHLSQCDWCQQQIQSRAAEPELWENAVALLAQAKPLEPRWPNASDALDQQQDDDAASGFQSRQIQSVLESLSPTDDPEMLGRIGDYEIIGVVGVGGMGAVLKGFDKSLRRVVAIKVMAPHLAGSGSARTRFQRESRAAAAITHDNVIDIYSVSEAGGLPYLVMPYARGPSLQKRIDEGGPLSVAEVLRIGRQIAAGLTAAHEQGLVHRDIKPANILLNDGIERLLITDFGVARAMDDASMTRTGVIAGTPQYMSPEQARGEAVDYRSDLFSLGSVLYTACTGRPPFRSEAAYGILRRITDDDPRPIREINPDIPDWLCRMINRLMAKHPADRFQSAAELSELLEGCLAHLQRPTHIDLPQSLASTSPTATDAQPAPQRVDGGDRSRSVFFSRTGVSLMASAFLFAAFGFVAMQVTAPADIAGDWQGDTWTSVSLSSVEEADGWYTGSFTAADGHQGALQLEWSRLQRRYNGRWKVGDGQSGSITLRAGDAGSIRGAVSVDADATIAAEAPRLWEFAWNRGAENKKSAAGFVIQSPVKGVVVWSKGINEGAAVKKGDVIAEIRPSDASEQERWQEQFTLAKQDVADAEARLESSKRNEHAMSNILNATEDQVESFNAIKQQLVAAGKATEASALSRVKAAEQQVAIDQAALTQLSAEYERMKGQYDQGLTSQKELEETERSYKEAEAKVAQSKASLEAIENMVTVAQDEERAKQTRVQVDIDGANVERAKAMSDLSKATSEVEKAEADLAKAQKRVEEWNVKLAQEQRLQILAPVSGHITEATSQQLIKEGDLICKLIADPADPESEKADSSQSVSPTPTPAGSVSETSPARPTPTMIVDNPIAQTFGPVSDLARRLREGHATVKQLDLELSAARSKHEAANAQAIAIDRKIQEMQQQPKSDEPKEMRENELRIEQLTQQLRSNQNISSRFEKDEAYKIASLENQRRQLSDAETERDTVVRLLESQWDAARKQLDMQRKLTEATRQGFNAGDLTLNDKLKAEQSLAETEAKVQQLELLLNMYQSLGSDPKSPQPEPATDSSQEEGDATP